MRAGSELDGIDIRAAFRIYRSTVDKFYWGRGHLNERVFELWASRMGDRMELVSARRPNGDLVAGAINFAKAAGSRRYWGCFEEVKHLHFNVCYYQGIQRPTNADSRSSSPSGRGASWCAASSRPDALGALSEEPAAAPRHREPPRGGGLASKRSVG